MLSHGNVVADFAGFLKVTDVSVVFIASVAAFLYHTVLFHLFFFLTLVSLQKVIFPNQDDCLISFLPLAHMFERLIEVS